MKKIISLVFLLVTLALNAQIKVTSTESKNVTIGKLGSAGATWVELTKVGDLCTFKYQDNSNQSVLGYKTFSFKDVDNALEGFYKVIADGLDNPPKDDVRIELPADIVTLKFTKEMGIVSVKITSSKLDGSQQGFTMWLTKRQINKLFAKT